MCKISEKVCQEYCMDLSWQSWWIEHYGTEGKKDHKTVLTY